MRRCCIVVGLLLAGGCTSLPEFDKVSGVRPNSIVDAIQCELIAARAEIERLRIHKKVNRSLCEFVAVADLSLQVDEQMALAPSFTHTGVVSQAVTRVFDWGVKLDTRAQRTFSQSVTFKINQLNEPAKGCRTKGVSLNGNLGLTEAVIMGLTTIDPSDNGVSLSADGSHPTTAYEDCAKYAARPPPSTARLAQSRSGGGRGGDREGKKKNAFSTQIEFVLVRNMNATGPSWTLQHFRGPGRLFSAQRTDTHSVTIAFANDEKAATTQNQKAAIESLRNNIRLLAPQ